MRLGWSADFVDPEAFVDVFESGNPQNTLGYSSAAYDGLLAKSRTETDGAKRMGCLPAQSNNCYQTCRSYRSSSALRSVS